MRNLVFLLLPVMALAGCSSPSIYIRSKIDSAVPVTKTSRITIFNPAEESALVKDFYPVLRPEMEQLGFDLVPYEQADFFLFADIREEIKGVRGRPPMLDYTYSDSLTLGPNLSPRVLDFEESLPYVKRYKVLSIYLTVCDMRMYKEDKTILPVWQGMIRAEETLYQENRDACLRILLNTFSTDFEGYVQIQKNE